MMCDRPIDIDSVASVDRLLRDYIELNFVVSGQQSKQQPIYWVGHEIESAEAWLYFEVEANSSMSSPASFQVTNRILFECCDTQRNHIQFKNGTTTEHRVATVERSTIQFDGQAAKKR